MRFSLGLESLLVKEVLVAVSVSLMTLFTGCGAGTASTGHTAASTLSATSIASTTMVLSSISPASGATAGGTAVLLYGSNFAAGAVAYFGGIAATQVTVLLSSQLQVVTPANVVKGSSITLPFGMVDAGDAMPKDMVADPVEDNILKAPKHAVTLNSPANITNHRPA